MLSSSCRPGGILLRAAYGFYLDITSANIGIEHTALVSAQKGLHRYKYKYNIVKQLCMCSKLVAFQ